VLVRTTFTDSCTVQKQNSDEIASIKGLISRRRQMPPPSQAAATAAAHTASSPATNKKLAKEDIDRSGTCNEKLAPARRSRLQR